MAGGFAVEHSGNEFKCRCLVAGGRKRRRGHYPGVAEEVPSDGDLVSRGDSVPEQGVQCGVPESGRAAFRCGERFAGEQQPD